MKSIEQFLEPRDIYEKIGGNASELSQEEHGFICGLIKKYRPKRIVELGVSGPNYIFPFVKEYYEIMSEI